MKEDKIIEVLSAVYNKTSPKISFDLIKECYEVEKQFLFEKDRNKPMDLLEKIVYQHVKSSLMDRGNKSETA